MPRYSVTFNTSISVIVDIEADDEDRAGDDAWTVAEDYLKTIGGNYRDVRAETTLDGIGYDTVELADDETDA